MKRFVAAVDSEVGLGGDSPPHPNSYLLYIYIYAAIRDNNDL